jgi:hypothetical protein
LESLHQLSNIFTLAGFLKEIESDYLAGTWKPYYPCEFEEFLFHDYFDRFSNYDCICLWHASCLLHDVGEHTFTLDIQNKEFFPLFVPLKNWDINWRTSDTMGIAQTMYATKDYSSRGILKDALMDAGCEEPNVFAVLNSPRLCRGAWVLEQLQ